MRNRLFKREAADTPPLGNVIRCHDCRELGYIAITGGETILPAGWKLTWAGLRPLYICKQCGEKRKTELLRRAYNGR